MRIALSAVVVLALVALPARAGAEEVGAGASSSAEKLALEGKWLLVQKRLDEAIERLETALAIAPDDMATREMLQEARAARAEAQAHYDVAEAHFRQQRWDEAAGEIGEAKRLFPKFVEADKLLDRVHRAAADAACASAREALGAGRVRDAEAAFRAALGYVADLVEARRGLAAIASDRAETAVARQQWGAALLWAREAADYAPNQPGYADRVEGLRARVDERVRFGLGLEYLGEGAPSADTADLLDAVRGRVGREAPAFVTAPVAPGAQAAFIADVEVVRLEVAGRLDRTENRIHAYRERREEPNPDYVRLRDLLDAAVRDLEVLVADYNTPCALCSGMGWVLCPACHGLGLHVHPPCPICSAGARPGYVVCSRCGGSGRWSTVTATDVYRQQRVVRQLQDQLARTPLVIVRDLPAEWPYTVEYHEKTGTLEASLKVRRADTGALVYTDAVRSHRQDLDTAIQNANTGVGLSPDPLELPADAVVRRSVLEEAAQGAASKILAAVVGLRAAEVREEADRLLAQGKRAEGVERGVDAAVLLAAVDPLAADVQMRDLRERLRLESP